MVNFAVLFFVIIALIARDVDSKISDKRLCANEDCTERISLAKTLLRYSSPEKGFLSVPQNAEVTVYSKSAGSNTNLWGIEYKGKRGYMNKNFLRETRVFRKDLKFLIDTELSEYEKVPSSDILSNKQKYSVVDGTTIAVDPNDINPSAAEENLGPTQSPYDSKESTIEENVETESPNGKKDEEEVKVESIADSVFSTITNFLEGAKQDATKNEIGDEDELEDADGEEAEEESDENEQDEEEDENDDISVEEAKVEEQLIAMIPKVYNEAKNEETNSPDGLTSDSNDGMKKIKSDGGDKDVYNEENKEDDQNDVSKENIQEESVDAKSVESLEIENPVTKSTMELHDNIGNVETVTFDPGKIDDSTVIVEHKLNETSEKAQEVDAENQPKDSNVNREHETLTKTENSKNENHVQDFDNDANLIGEQMDASKNFISDLELNDTSISSSENLNSNQIDNKENETLNLPDLSNMPDSVQGSENLENSMLGGQELTNSQLQKENLESSENEVLEGSQTATKLPPNIIHSLNDIQNESGSNQNVSDSHSGVQTENIFENSVENVPEQLVEENRIAEKVVDELTENVSETADKDSVDLREKGFVDTREKAFENISENLSENISVETFEDSSEKPSEDSSERPSEDSSEKPSEEKLSEYSPDNMSEALSGELLEGSYEKMSEDSSEKPPEHSSEKLAEDLTEKVFKDDPSEKVSDDLSDKIQETLSKSNKEESGGLTGFYNSWFGGADAKAEEIGVAQNVDSKSVEHKLELVQEDTPENSDILVGNTNTENLADIGSSEKEQSAAQIDKHEHNFWTSLPHLQGHEHHVHEEHDEPLDDLINQGTCSAGGDDCPNFMNTIQKQLEMDFSSINFTDVLNLVTVLGITGITVVIFLLGYIAIDKSRREGPLIAKINKLEKALLVSTKENQILSEKVSDGENVTITDDDILFSPVYIKLQKEYQEVLELKSSLEDQIQTLEKELENSTEVGLELNRMLSEILSSQSGSETLVANVEQLQRQLVEQQSTINSINATLNLKDTENHELQLELDIKNKKVIDLQAELDKMALNLLKAEEEKDQIQTKLEAEIQVTKEQLDKMKSLITGNNNKLSEETNSLRKRCAELQKSLDLKTSEYNILKENLSQIKMVKNNKDVLSDLLQCTTFKAELVEVQKENNTLNELLAQERQIKVALEQRIEEVLKEFDELKIKYDDVDKEKLEAKTKLEVLGNYFKEREAELQRELAKQEALWAEKQGEATSSTERIKYVQEELQNCKAQNELLKQEIVSQEIELKSQISVLEKKAHESWLSARQAERRLEEAKQEAAQLRNRLTLKERSFAEDKGQHRMQSPLEQNGEVASPLHMPVESPASPPLLYPTRDHMTTSPPLPPFLPPPPGVPPFMPPPPGVPGFMPPPPSMFPVDHRPPPLGRMSSPPLNSRYSPDSRYSPYDDRNSPSPPPFDDDDYRPSTPPRHNRSYSPYRDERREYNKRTGARRTNGRTKGVSSGSENSNSETIDRTNRHHTKI